MLEFNPELDFKLLLAVPLIPLAGYLLQITLRGRLPHGDKLLTAGMFVSMCITVFMAAKAVSATHHGLPFLNHSSAGGMEIGWFYGSANVPTHMNVVTGLFYDPLGAIMLAVVGIVSFCVHLFSIGYMHGDKRYAIFFANISLFTFAMLGLVLADNILFLFIFWEIMGLMSYLLIGHFSHDPGQPFFHKWATWASKKAFMTTRIGDVCLLIGILMFYREFSALWEGSEEVRNQLAAATGTTDFHPLRFTHLWEMARIAVAQNAGEFPAWMTTAGLFAFGGTVGKSAQFPLHIWLPDAMAGPTPVSAMIHAATMVAAGVFLLGRLFPLFTPEVLAVVTVFGSVTALLAAGIGMTVFDLKAVLAYSTISQLGFMVAAVGLGGVVAGMFHMVTHAFFKACLFLSAGSVIHGCHHVQDMRVMGGLRKKMPITFFCMGVCTLAIAGVPWFSGFFSKDAILLAGWANVVAPDHGNGWGGFALVCLGLGAMFTAFYMCRLMFMTFFGEYRGDMKEHRFSAMLAAEGFEGPEPHGHDDHGDGHDSHGHDEHGGHGDHGVHESPKVMTIPLLVLALIGVPGLAYFLNDWVTHLVTVESLYGSEVAHWVNSRLPEALTTHDTGNHFYHASHLRAVILSLVVASAGIGGAWLFYHRKKHLPGKFILEIPPIYNIVRARYKVDELVELVAIKPSLVLAKTLRWVDEKVVDGVVNAMGLFHRISGTLSAWVDSTFVDGVVNGVGLLSQNCGALLRLFQTGRIQQYAAFALGGALLTVAWLILA